MLFRINYKNFLLHMIDYFTADELTSLQYAVISAGIAVNGSERENVVKLNMLYPSSEITSRYLDDENEDILRKTYTSELKTCDHQIFIDIVQPIVTHYHNIVLINLEKEDVYTDVLVEYIKKEFGMSCIDLNELFTEGETELYFIDRKDIRDRNVKLARSIAKAQLEGYESNDQGRLHLIKNVMSDKDKIAKLKELGVKRLKRDDLDRLDELLIETWLDYPS